jgi:hypothetical protein
MKPRITDGRHPARNERPPDQPPPKGTAVAKIYGTPARGPTQEEAMADQVKVYRLVEVTREERRGMWEPGLYVFAEPTFISGAIEVGEPVSFDQIMARVRRGANEGHPANGFMYVTAQEPVEATP